MPFDLFDPTRPVVMQHWLDEFARKVGRGR